MLQWQILDTGRRSAEENMRIDAELLNSLDAHSPCTLHFYDWEGDSATYGYFVEPSEFLDLKMVELKGLKLARRPTGGGIVFHLWDLAFSVLVPSASPIFSQNVLDNYKWVNERVLACIKKWLGEDGSLISESGQARDAACDRFCMANPTRYDVMLGSRKVAGAAQRQTKRGFLHQGTISLVQPSESYLQELLLPGTQVLEAMRLHAAPDGREIQSSRREMRELLKREVVDR